MKLRLNFSLLFLLAATLWGFGQDLLKVVDQTVKPTGYTEGHNPNWPELDSDGNRNPEQALIIVKYDGFPEEEIVNIDITPDITPLNRREELKDPLDQPITFLYVSIDNHNLSFSSKYGPARVPLINLQNGGIYEMTLLVDKKMNIDVEPLTDYDSVTVYLDRGQGKTTPARFNNVSLGKHSLMFELPDGSRVAREINVTVNSDRFNETNTPELDLRHKMPVKIESTSGNVSVFVDDVEVAKSAPVTVHLPMGDHTVKIVTNGNDREFDIATLKLDRDSKDVSVKLNPRERRKFEVTASYEGMDNVPMMLYIGKEEAYKFSEDHAKGERRSYMFDLPVGSEYKFRATYQGHEGNRTIKVTPDIGFYQNIRIKKRKKIVWPWEREYVAPPVGLTAAYVQKQYQIKQAGETVYKGSLVDWDDAPGGNHEWLHGIKAGVQYQPTFGFGLGLYTGLFYEYFRSTTDLYVVDKEEGLTSNFSKYEEHSLSLPVELFYNFPFASKVALAFHAGLEGNFMLARSYSGFVEEIDGIKFEESYDALKDEDNYFPYLPGMFNLYWQIGVQLRLGPVMLGAQMTRPVLTHKWTDELSNLQFTTTSFKNSFSLTYVF